jgi:predicted nucleic acid-binding protein
MAGNALVLDANILIRATLGAHVVRVIEQQHDQVRLLATSTSIEDAHRHLPQIVTARHMDLGPATDVLEDVTAMVQEVGPETYAPAMPEAMERIGKRDPDDADILATALVLDCPVWTEDQDFFGTGVPTWTTTNLESYFDREQLLVG